MLHLVYVVMEPSLHRALASAAGQVRAGGVALSATGFLLHDLSSPSEYGRFCQALAETDLFLGAVLNLDTEVQRMGAALGQHRPPVVAVFHSQVEALAWNRLGDFDGQAWSADGTMRRLLGHLRAAGVPLPGMANVVLAALPRIESLLPQGEFTGLRAYAQAAQLWTEGTTPALAALLLHLINQHPDTTAPVAVPRVEPTPQVALWHPEAPRAYVDLEDFRGWYGEHLPDLPRREPVAVLLHRRWVAAEDTQHFRAVIGALEAEGLAVYPAFSDLDVAPLVERYWRPVGVRLLLNLTSFNLVGGHGRPSPERAVAALRELDVPYLAAVPLTFQTLAGWRGSRPGLTAPQLVMQVVMPELEGGAEPWVFAGPAGPGATTADAAATARLARRVRRWADLAGKPPAARRVAVVLFSVPPGKGSLGTAAYLDVFASLHHLLRELQAAGYDVGGELPPDPVALLQVVLGGEGIRYGSGELPVAGRLSLTEYRRHVPAWREISRCWGPPPGEFDTDGQDLLILGRAFGNVLVAVQPSFGYEGDPLRLLFHPDATPSHAFAGFYAWVAHRWQADALLHFGTHGALEFMPGKQAGLSPDCWPARLAGELPHLYLYAVNNPSEASIAKRRGGAITIGYRTPPLAQAGLYRTLAELQETVTAFRTAGSPVSRQGAWEALLALADRAQLHGEVHPPAAGDQADAAAAEDYADRLGTYLHLLASRLIAVGLHVAGQPADRAETESLLRAAAWIPRPEWSDRSLPDLAGEEGARELAHLLASGEDGRATTRADQLGVPEPFWQKIAATLGNLRTNLQQEQELPCLLRALDGRYTPPGAGGDPVRNPAVLPGGRNLHALDPWKVPTLAATRAGAIAIDRLLARIRSAGQDWPEAVALVLWGSDNIKTGGEGVAQALALLGAVPEADSLGRVSRVRLVPLAELGRPRIDVVATCSGIFRDLFPGIMQLLAAAAAAAAVADEPISQNFVKKHALELAAELAISPAEAARRVFAAPAGLYGTGINHVVEEGAWQGEQDLAEAYIGRMGYSWGTGDGAGQEARPLLRGLLRRAPVTLQNVDSTEVGIGDIDHYFEHLGGLTAAAGVARGGRPTPWLVDSTAGMAEVRSLQEAVRIEVRTRLLNPRWYEGMLKHGYQGVHEVAVRLENTYGWLATTGAVDGWALDGAADTFLLDAALRQRMASLNPRAVRRMAERLLEAAHRGLWQADPGRVAALGEVVAEIDDRMEGAAGEVAS